MECSKRAWFGWVAESYIYLSVERHVQSSRRKTSIQIEEKTWNVMSPSSLSPRMAWIGLEAFQECFMRHIERRRFRFADESESEQKRVGAKTNGRNSRTTGKRKTKKMKKMKI